MSIFDESVILHMIGYHLDRALLFLENNNMYLYRWHLQKADELQQQIEY